MKNGLIQKYVLSMINTLGSYWQDVLSEEDIMKDLSEHFDPLPEGEWRIHEVVEVLRRWYQCGAISTVRVKGKTYIKIEKWKIIEDEFERCEKLND